MKQNEINLYLILMSQRLIEINYQLDRYIELIYDRAYVKGLENVCDNNFQNLMNSLTSLKMFINETRPKLEITCNFEDKHYLELVDNIRMQLKLDMIADILDEDNCIEV